MFENLGQQIQTSIRGLRGEGHLSDINIARAVKEIRRALVSADVNYKLAKEVTDHLKTQVIGEKVKLSVSPGQYFTKLMEEALTELMGSKESTLSLKKKPSVILVVGLQGTGKTTFSAKLALYLKKQGHRTSLIACDVYRPAAVEQLQTLGKQIDVEVYTTPESKDVIEVAKLGVSSAKRDGASVVILDTAGRLTVDRPMMEELRSLKVAVQPEETIFVLDAMMGQDAVETAQAFQKEVNFEGVAITKLDGDSRGGAVLSVKATTERPIKFSSEGEDLSSLDVFYPNRMAQRILGMGDVLSFVEKAQEQFDQQEARELAKKIQRNTFDLNDFLNQIRRIRKMGKLKDLAAMLPGIGQKIKQLDIDDQVMKRPEVIIQSMTPYERQNPYVIKNTRKLRIAKGSGNDISEVSMLLKRYELMRKMMKKASTGDTRALESMFEGKR